MADVNLLPWREAERERRAKNLMIAAVMVIICAALLVLVAKLYVNGMQSHQSSRNQFLSLEIRKLNKKIKDIEELKSQKAELISRMDVVQDLQNERSKIVHVFDDIVRKLPEGVYFSSLEKEDRRLEFKGTASSNATVSELMNHLDSSSWFSNPTLRLIEIKPEKNIRLSQFNIGVSEKSDDDDAAG